MNLENVKAYELVEKRSLKELDSEGYLLKHKKTGARVFILENSDVNKVFCIGFRTPPEDSTGVPHIMEHSVLCGSKRFPAKDPFVELAKGSLNTFLNAMTYPDKTVYPVASCNDKDFNNLMHVYMDAVFYPNIYKRPEIFKQEGWHYELGAVDEPITINGVVYNEMKGAFSSPEDMVDRKTYEALYPDTAYALESGGDPEIIPQLTYEGFLDFHKKFYHPSNSYIYLYGNANMEERLNWLDENYLSVYDHLELDSSIKLQKSFDEMKEQEIAYSITEDEPLEGNTYLSYSCVVDTVLNRKLYMAFQILEYALLSAPGAPLKEALIKAGIGNDVMSTYENGILQPYFSVMVKNADASDKDRFLETIKSTLNKIVQDGIDQKALEAGINYYEFKFREADFGSYPKGLMYGLQSFDSWLYDDNDPFMHICQTETIDALKKEIGTGYFEKLISRYILDNTHSALIIAKPERGLTAIKDEALAKKLAEYKSTLSDAEIAALVEATRLLKEYQEIPSTQEELETIPLLEIADIEKKAESFENEELIENGVKYLYHDVKTNGIGYLTLLFDLDTLPHELIPYASLLKSILCLISTKNYDYSELSNEVNRQSGGIQVSLGTYNLKDMPGKYKAFLEVDAKMLIHKTDFVIDMLSEILFDSDFTDKVRIHELMQMIKSRMQMAFMSSGHTAASLRALSYFSQLGCFSDMTSGYAFYQFINDLLEDYDNKAEAIERSLKECLSYLLCKDRLLVDFTGDREAFIKIRESFVRFNDKLSDAINPVINEEFKLDKKNEGFKSSSQVQYVAVTGNYKKAGLDYTGALKVLRVIMAYDYLWINVRVKGGAYGCMNNFPRSGDSYFVSYRDPNLSETLDIYNNAKSYLESFDPEDRDMTKYIIGTISDMDTPMTPKMRGNRDLSAYIAGITYADVQKERDEVLSADKAAIRRLSEYVDAMVSQKNLCVIGAEEKIKDNKQLFNNVVNLF